MVLVDWSDGSYHNQTWYYINRYMQASNNALTMGRVLACFVARVALTYSIPETSIHIVGHSLGAQMMGRAVAWLFDNFNIRVGRGTGEAREASHRHRRGQNEIFLCKMN